MSSLATRNRVKLEDEDASKLQLGKEFINAGTLSVSELHILLQQRQETQLREKSDNPVFRKTEDYVNHFARFTDAEQAYSVRQIFGSRDLDIKPFEVTQLMNLCPESAEEAKAIIPSLAPIDDEVLQEMLNGLATQKAYKA